MAIDKSLYEAPDGKKNKKILLASESPAEEADLELDSLMKQYEEWKKKNKGSFQDFLDDDAPVVTIKLADGGSAEVEKDLLGKRVRELMDEGYEFGEAVRQAMKEGYAKGGRAGYINRIRAAEKNKND